MTWTALIFAAAVVACASVGCSSSPSSGSSAADGMSGGSDGESAATSGDSASAGGSQGQLAAVIGVTATGDPSNYTFSVSIESPDVGCSAYADWWEVVTPSGQLVYRRILAHSHVDEQPFSRSGGPVDVAESDPLVVRAHFSVGGYGGSAMGGSIADGFQTDDTIDASFAEALAEAAPQPNGCAF